MPTRPVHFVNVHRQERSRRDYYLDFPMSLDLVLLNEGWSWRDLILYVSHEDELCIVHLPDSMHMVVDAYGSTTVSGAGGVVVLIDTDEVIEDIKHLQDDYITVEVMISAISSLNEALLIDLIADATSDVLQGVLYSIDGISETAIFDHSIIDFEYVSALIKACSKYKEWVRVRMEELDQQIDF